MKKIIYIFLIFNFHFLIVTAQPHFQKTIGGTNHDHARSIIQTTDGGFAIAGYTFSFASGYEDMYIVKLNSSGSIQWTRTVGGSGNDYALSIIQTTDGGYAVAGHTNSFGTDYADFYIVKLDAGGSLQWNRTIDRADYDYGISVVQTTDGGFAMTGVSATGGVFSGDIYVVKLDASGTYLWSKTYGGSADEVGFSIIQTTDGGLVVAGYTDSFGLGGNNFYIIKLDTSGTLQWSRTVGGSGPNGSASSIIQTTDGGFVLAGETMAFGAGSNDMHIVKLDANGTLQWTRTVGGSSQDWGYSIIQTQDGGFAVTGSTTSFGVNNFYAVKLNSSGAHVWSKTYGGSGVETPNSIIKTTDGGFVIAGETTSFGAGANDIFIVKIDSLGNTCGNTTTPSTISGTGGTLGNPSTIVVNQSPTVNTPASISGTGGILNIICSTAQPPLAPLLVSPPNGSYNQTSTIRFIWNRPLFAATYRIQIALDSIFNSMVYNDSTLTDSTIVVANLLVNKYYWWRVNAKNSYGTSPYSSVWRFGTFPVGLKHTSSEIPDNFELYNNYPNPFNPVTKIKFDLPSVGQRHAFDVRVVIYNILGREVAALVDQQLKPGTYEAEFDGSNYPSGVYFYTLTTETFTQTRKMVLIK